MVGWCFLFFYLFFKTFKNCSLTCIVKWTNIQHTTEWIFNIHIHTYTLVPPSRSRYRAFPIPQKAAACLFPGSIHKGSHCWPVVPLSVFAYSWTLYISGIIQYILFYVWLLSLILCLLNSTLLHIQELILFSLLCIISARDYSIISI